MKPFPYSSVCDLFVHSVCDLLIYPIMLVGHLLDMQNFEVPFIYLLSTEVHISIYIFSTHPSASSCVLNALHNIFTFYIAL